MYLDVFGGGMYSPTRGCRLLFRTTKQKMYITDDDIVIDITNHPQYQGKWTYPELDDLRQAFVKMVEQKIGVNTTSCIEMNYANPYIDEDDAGSSGDDDDDAGSEFEEFEEFETPVYM